MQIATSLKGNKLFIAYVIITAITSFLSIGFYHVDEHFQILEFGAWKAGWISAQDLPWEFTSALRSGIEPFIVAVLIKVLSIFNADNPFMVALLFRWLTASICLSCFYLWRRHLSRSADLTGLQKWFDAALLFWFVPYLSVRFSSEIWGGGIFFISLALLYGEHEKCFFRFLLAGALASLAFFLRFQTAFLIGGFLCYLFFFSRKQVTNFYWYLLGFICMSLVNVCIDSFFYHQWCLTPWNYFYENVINARAASFGTEPFYYYFEQLMTTALPLHGLVLVAAFAIYIVRKIRDEVSMAVLFFLAAHIIAGHKEIRFMFPLVFILPFVFAGSMHWVAQQSFTRNIFFKIMVVLFIVTNSVMLAIGTLKPADTQVALQRAIYHLAVNNNSTLVFYESTNPYERVGLKMNFYKNKNMKLLLADSLSYFRDTLTNRKLLVTTVKDSSLSMDRKKLHRVYQSIPQWIVKMNFNDWLSRTTVYRVYDLNEIPD